MTEKEKIRLLLLQLYGGEAGAAAFGRLDSILKKYHPTGLDQPRAAGLSERDSVLITYPDQVQEPGRPSLPSLCDFCEKHLNGVVSSIHLLPFFPWSSDDGFSVIDYRGVAPQYGSWADVKRLGEHFRLMFDAVINHASTRSEWFQDFLHDEPTHREYFIEVEGNPDLSAVVRPRALPLLTHFRTSAGEKTVWTTFSADQADLNYHNPDVLLDMLDVLLFYASQGAEFIRLDAIAYLWKEIGTSCIHLLQTHKIVQLIRAILDEVAPQVILLTETNVPQTENLSYFGDGTNEAQLIYNFPLPPLVLHTFLTGNAQALSRWASDLKLPSGRVAFLNFLASHDGIGLNPLRGLLPEREIEAMAQRIKSSGGLVSNKNDPDGTQSPYELNVNYFDALDDPNSNEPPARKVDRFVTAHAILFSLVGLPGVYFHSLFGSRGWPEGAAQSGHNRSINRQKLQRDQLECELSDSNSLRAQIFHRLSRLLTVRGDHRAFSPHGTQRALESGKTVFSLVREDADAKESVLCVHNVSAEPQQVNLNISDTSLAPSSLLRDLIDGGRFEAGESLSLALAPYQTLWLTQ